jgi:hypothetical protein
MRGRSLILIVLAGLFALLAMGADSCSTSGGGGGKHKSDNGGVFSGNGRNNSGGSGASSRGGGSSAGGAPSDGGCTPGYSPCLPPASDYDCQGGSGDGPEYTGQVSVTGSDPYGLDTDSDGTGCE